MFLLFHISTNGEYFVTGVPCTTFKGSNIPSRRLEVAVNRMADKFQGGELWIGNWGSGEGLKVIEILDGEYSDVKLTATSSCKSIPPMRLVPFLSRSRKCQRKRQTRVVSEHYLPFVSFLLLL